ncbi:MAG: carbohydrate ABC transporter permease [Rhodobacteraceae bacterium]|nr:carbohydrate ABC transporter permease [Paracoccaceae bacterium]MCY4327474.1 carbohydrate ABC transporter permease [Paracoccaceae bacterium]
MLTIFVFFLLMPILWMLSTSFKAPEEVFLKVPTIIPEEPTLRNYMRALTETRILTYLYNGLIVSMTNAALTTVLAALAAYGFAKFRFKGRKSLMFLMISAQMFPYAVLLISLYPFMQRTGLFDTRSGLILAYLVFAMPASIYILFSYIVNLPDELIEAARMDGADEWLILRELILPLLTPGLITVFLYSFMWSWNDLLYSLTLISSETKRTVGPGLLLTFLGEMEQDWGAAMAGSVIVSLPIILAFTFLQRFFVQGLTAGAVK